MQETVAKVGLRINVGKIKEMRINATYTQNFKVNGIKLKNCKSFCFLGSIISANGGSKEDITNG